MLGSVLSQVSLLFLVVTCVTAVFAGGTRERLGAGYYLMAFVAQAGLYRLGYGHIGINLGLDGLLLIGLLSLCWKSPHPWPVWAFGFQLLSFMIQVVSLLDSRIMAWAYYTAMTLSGYAVLSAIIAGTLAARRRLKTSSRVAQVKI